MHLSALRSLMPPSVTHGTRAPFALAIPVILVAVAGCSALTRVPPKAVAPVVAPAPVRSIAAGAVRGFGLPACGPALEVKSSAAAPLKGRLPLLPGLTITEAARTSRSVIYKGFIKGRADRLADYREGADGPLRAAGYSVKLRRQTARLSSSSFTGIGGNGQIVVSALCRGFVSVQYIISTNG